MFHISEILHGIERRAERAVVHELRLMTQEILSMRTHLSIDHRAHADALLLKLDHLERCQHIQVSGTTEEASAPPPADTATPGLPFDDLEALQPSHYLAHFYDHDAGDLDGVALTETLAAAVQLVREHLAQAPSLVFNKKDDLQARWVRRLCHRDVELPRHAVPSPHAFVAAALAGMGWGLHPQELIASQLSDGSLVELVPQSPLDVPLYWQHARAASSLIEGLSRELVAAATRALRPP